MQRCFSLALAVAVVAACAPALAKDLNPSDYPLNVEVLAFQRETAVRDGGTQTQTNCLGTTNGNGTATTYDGGDNYNIQTNSTTATSCNSSTEHMQYVYRGAGMQVKVGDRVYVVECMSRLPGIYAKLSKCSPLLPGQYAARWHGNQLEILTTKSNGKYSTIGYFITGTAEASTPNISSGTCSVKDSNEQCQAVMDCMQRGGTRSYCEMFHGRSYTEGNQSAAQPTQNTQAAEVMSEVSITSTPTGADISIDGNFVGNTPSSISVAAGDHTISIGVAGYQLWERKVHTSGGKINLNATLAKSDARELSNNDAQSDSIADAARATRAKQAAQSSKDPHN